MQDEEKREFTIVVNKGTQEEQEVQSEGGPLMVVVCQEGIQIDFKDPDIEEIGPEQTVAYSNALPQEHWYFLLGQARFMELWNVVFPQLPVPPELAKGTLAHKHIVGMIMLGLKAMSEGKRPFFRLPESYLHPSTQRLVVSLFHAMQGKDREEDAKSKGLS